MSSILVGTVILLFGFLVLKILRFWDKMRLQQRLKSMIFKQLYKKSILEVVDVCEQLKLVYWFTEGTLIGLLRYGANHHESRDLSVDDDIDVMVEVGNQEEWIQVKTLVKQALAEKGWTNLYERTTSSSKKGRIDKMQLWKYEKDTFTHVDFHSYFVDFKRDFAYSHKEPDSYPFQFWSGKLPVDLIYPLRKASCYGMAVPCPNKPIQLLKGWNGAEYLSSCLAFPPGKLSLEEKKEISNCCNTLDIKGFASMKSEILNC